MLRHKTIKFPWMPISIFPGCHIKFPWMPISSFPGCNIKFPWMPYQVSLDAISSFPGCQSQFSLDAISSFPGCQSQVSLDANLKFPWMPISSCLEMPYQPFQVYRYVYNKFTQTSQTNLNLKQHFGYFSPSTQKHFSTHTNFSSPNHKPVK